MSQDLRLFSIIMDSVIGILGILLNCLLLYLIVTQSPTKIKVYRLLLINSCVNDMITSLLMILLVPRVIGYHWTLVVTSRGIAQFFSREFCFLGMSIFFATFSHTLITLLVSFVYRYYIIKKTPPLGRSLLCVIFLVSLPSILIVAFFATSLDSLDSEYELLNIIKVYYTEAELKDEVVYGFKDIRDWRIAYCILVMGGCAVPIYIVIFVVRKLILRYLSKQTVSQKGIKLQKEIIKVLSCQAFLPSLFFLTVIMYFWSQSTDWTNPVLECSVFLTVSLIPILSPIISILFVKPYRSWLVWHFGSLFKPKTVVVSVQRCSD